MHRRHFAAIVAAASAVAIVVAGTAAFVTDSGGTKQGAAVLPVAMPEPDGAEEWMYLQRANPDGSIPDAAVNEAIAQSKAAGQASKGSPATDQVWTELGPSNIGGRVRDIAVDPTTQDVVYIATGSGGLWRSADGGATFSTAWDHYLPQSMGAVAVDSQGVVWAGSGEPDHGGGSAYYGKGIYRSTDDGATWTNMGLEDGDTIGQIVIDPRDDDRVFVAVMGALHDTEPSRGLFLTEDGGATWTRVIVPESTSTGAIDVAINKSNPDVMLATTWDKIRDEKSRIYGPHSYVYRSTDGGHTWANVQQRAAPAERDGPGAADAGQPRRPDGRRLQRQRSEPRVPDLQHRARQLQRLLHEHRCRRSRGRRSGRPRAARCRTSAAASPGGSAASTSTRSTRSTSSSTASTSREPQRRCHLDDVADAVHADQHGVEWDPFTPNKVFLGNDGGFYWSPENGRHAALWTKTAATADDAVLRDGRLRPGRLARQRRARRTTAR